MPGNVIEAVTVAGTPWSPPPLGVTLGFRLTPASSPFSGYLRLYRGYWETTVAAIAIRDTFKRRGLGDVLAVGFTTESTAATNGISQLPPPQPLREGAGGWAQIQTRLDTLARRFLVRIQLHRFTPFGKAPFLEITTADPAAFIEGGAYIAFLGALRFNDVRSRSARYHGIMLLVHGPRGYFLTSAIGATGSSMCTYSAFPHARPYCHD